MIIRTTTRTKSRLIGGQLISKTTKPSPTCCKVMSMARARQVPMADAFEALFEWHEENGPSSKVAVYNDAASPSQSLDVVPSILGIYRRRKDKNLIGKRASGKRAH